MRKQIYIFFLCVQDEDKKSAAGDGQTTEDESSQDSKGESVAQAEAQGNMDVDQPNKTEQSERATEGQDCYSLVVVSLSVHLHCH